MSDSMQDKQNSAAIQPPLDAEEQRLAAYEHSFIGWYSHSLDSKGRMVVPQSFREMLGESFYVAPSFDFKSIALYPRLAWARERDKYARLASFNTALSRYLEMFDALSFRDQECDSQGRILLPAKIRQMILGNEKDVEITGANDHVRVVASVKDAQNAQYFMDHVEEYTAILNQMGAMPAPAMT
ncbi:MAG: hypothetical protein IJ246_06370 [Clostridia bacterium]|nr:hypothetical protein [Clostridia bacterium]